MKKRTTMAIHPILFTAFFAPFFALASQSQHNDHQVIAQLNIAKLKIARLESSVEELNRNLSCRSVYMEEQEKRIQGLEIRMDGLTRALSSLKAQDDGTSERILALEEEVRKLWAASRKSNFDLYELKLKAQDDEERLQSVSAKVKQMAEIITERWIQIQHLEQALQLTQMRAAKAQKQRFMRCPFLKFCRDISQLHIPNFLGVADSYSSGKVSALTGYLSQALEQLNRYFSAIKKYHHELQGMVKREMESNELTASLANDELIFFLVSALFTFPVLTAWAYLTSN